MKKRTIYDLSTFIITTAGLIFLFFFIASHIGVDYVYDDIEEDYVFKNGSIESIIILGIIAVFFLMLWYFHSKFFNSIYKHLLDKEYIKTLKIVQKKYSQISSFELDNMIHKESFSYRPPFGGYYDEERERERITKIREYQMEIDRRSFQKRFHWFTNDFIGIVIAIVVSFCIGLLWK